MPLTESLAEPPGGPNRVDSDSPSDSDSTLHGRFLPGTKIADRYRIVCLAGRGGMGEVYRADDLKLGHPVALKFLPSDLADTPSRMQALLNEVRLSRQISHPNICRVYDIGEVGGQQFLSMEYVDGEDLKGLLQRIGRLPKGKGIHIAHQLCAGLAAAHDRGVLHRDLKPANIMIDGRGQARIMDFGLARPVSGPAKTDEIAGTPAYMAPEQLARGETSIQSDLYSLGLILYEMFTGERVHKGDSIADLLRAREEASITAPSALVEGFDPAVERSILQCLRREAQERPVWARAVAAGLPGGDPRSRSRGGGDPFARDGGRRW
jgi:serine/threonine protein kinase